MTREKFNSMTFDDLMEWADENLDDITDRETLLRFAEDSIGEDRLYLALHILHAVYEAETSNLYVYDCDTEWYRYDYNMGTLQTPSPVTCKEDIEDMIDFEGED